MTTKLVLALGALIFAPPLSAQNVSAVQQCVWQCLSGSPGADSSEYAQCVEDRCAGNAGFIQARTDRWVSNSLKPEEPPYLDGRSAEVASFDGSLRLSYVCGRNGDSYFFIEGMPLANMGLDTGGPHKVTFTVDRRPGHSFDASPFEGHLTFGIAQDHSFLTDLKAGSGLFIDFPRWATDFTLSGSSRAFDLALAYCVSPTAAPIATAKASDQQAQTGPRVANVTPFYLSDERQAELRAEAETGDPAALNRLGVALVSGRFGTYERTGFDLISQAAEAGLPAALVNRAYIQSHATRTMTEALADLKRAAEAGDPVALSQIAFAYDVGYGTPADEAKAFEYHERAFAAGDWDSAMYLSAAPDDKGTYLELTNQAIDAGHRASIFNALLIDHYNFPRPDALSLLIEAASGVSWYHSFDDGLRYLPNMAMDSDADLYMTLIHTRRYSPQSWSGAEWDQILRPFQQRYDCLDGVLFMETTEVFACQR